MMPNPEDIYAYDIIGDGWLWKRGGRYKTVIYPLGPSTVAFSLKREHWRSKHIEWLELHFEVDCLANGFRLIPLEMEPGLDRPLLDRHAVGTASAEMRKFAPQEIEETLAAFGLTKIAEHITRSRLELWRVAALSGEPQEAVEKLWDSYLEAETAITWSWPGIEWEFLIPQEQSEQLRSGFGI